MEELSASFFSGHRGLIQGSERSWKLGGGGVPQRGGRGREEEKVTHSLRKEGKYGRITGEKWGGVGLEVRRRRLDFGRVLCGRKRKGCTKAI